MKGKPLSPEQKAKMAAGRKAALERKADPVEAAEPVVAVVLTDEAREARRRRLLAGLPPETAALISDDDLLAIEREETDKALAEKKKKGLKDARAMARQYALIEHDLLSPETLRDEETYKRLNEKVKIRVNLPEGGGALGFRVDGDLIRNGEERVVTRAQYESLLDTFYRLHLNEVMFSELNQGRRGNTARDILDRRRPQLEVVNG